MSCVAWFTTPFHFAGATARVARESWPSAAASAAAAVAASTATAASAAASAVDAATGRSV